MLITVQALSSVMVSKKISFKYTGGEYTQNFNIRVTNLPWTWECDADWLAITTGAMSLTVKVAQTYDFATRNATIRVFDKFRNELDLEVEQTGYMDLSVECPTSIVLTESYYNDNKTYDVYVTVYGGPTQEVSCKKIEPYLDKVWDNSDMYNDFIVRIPKELSGSFTVKHSDWKKFKTFCEESGIEYPKSEVEKKISITQVSTKDTIGELVLEYNGEKFTNWDDMVTIEVGSNETVEIKVVSAKFVAVVSRTKCITSQDKDVKITSAPMWLDANIVGNKIMLKCNESNPFADRYGMLIIENLRNFNQKITIMVKQKSGT